MVEEVTGQRPIGYNANWLRRGPNTLSLLQELGYVYHIDDTSRDEPFIEKVNGKDFVVIPRCATTTSCWWRAGITRRTSSSNRSSSTLISSTKKRERVGA